ncbi:MAG: septum formation initiator family protein [Eubacteriales bacterium]
MGRNNEQMRSRTKRVRRKQKNSRRIIMLITASLLVVLGISTISSYAKNQAYIEQEIELMAQLQEEQERTIEIAEFKEYTTTDEYVEEIAREKLGLVYSDEIIFTQLQ